ncbi:hypothetical protein CFIMG_004453RA [Ceratocystis fimbriata CBS 114723]|uniref:Uncharacterized protein n=1 Tax=Ceratocystis fimbriata CBS 114723 TaxID=1035309 RepID=A0A2C5WZQ3_9PEZI|nr:hypothetical protein CFIMG_004453RA [Ceratocystis fimbriata CBS 114723]
MAAVFFPPTCAPGSGPAGSSIPDQIPRTPPSPCPVSNSPSNAAATDSSCDCKPMMPIMQRARPRPRRRWKLPSYDSSSASASDPEAHVSSLEDADSIPAIESRHRGHCPTLTTATSAQGLSTPSSDAPSYSTGLSSLQPNPSYPSLMRYNSCTTAPIKRTRNMSPYPLLSSATTTTTIATAATKEFAPPLPTSSAHVATASDIASDDDDGSSWLVIKSPARSKIPIPLHSYRRANTMGDSKRFRSNNNTWYSSVVSAIRKVGEPSDEYDKIEITGQLRLSSPRPHGLHRSSTSAALSRLHSRYRSNSTMTNSGFSSTADDEYNTDSFYEPQMEYRKPTKLAGYRPKSDAHPLSMAPMSATKNTSATFTGKPKRALKNISETLLTRLWHSDREDSNSPVEDSLNLELSLPEPHSQPLEQPNFAPRAKQSRSPLGAANSTAMNSMAPAAVNGASVPAPTKPLQLPPAEPEWPQSRQAPRHSFFSLKLGHGTHGNLENTKKKGNFRRQLRFRGFHHEIGSETDAAAVHVPQWLPEDWKPFAQLTLLESLQRQALTEDPAEWQPYNASAASCVLQHPRPNRHWGRKERAKWQYMGDTARHFNTAEA